MRLARPIPHLCIFWCGEDEPKKVCFALQLHAVSVSLSKRSLFPHLQKSTANCMAVPQQKSTHYTCRSRDMVWWRRDILGLASRSMWEYCVIFVSYPPAVSQKVKSTIWSAYEVLLVFDGFGVVQYRNVRASGQCYELIRIIKVVFG